MVEGQWPVANSQCKQSAVSGRGSVVSERWNLVELAVLDRATSVRVKGVKESVELRFLELGMGKGRGNKGIDVAEMGIGTGMGTEAGMETETETGTRPGRGRRQGQEPGPGRG